MLDAALIKECADPSLKPAIIEQFIAAVGSSDPLAITVRSGDRLILVPRPRNAQEAIEIVRQNIGGSVVRVGLTQFPVGGEVVDDATRITDLVDPCTNLRMGTAMFAKVLRIVARWYGNPTNVDVFPQLFDDAIHAWRTGRFDGENVFQTEDPGVDVMQERLSSQTVVVGEGEAFGEGIERGRPGDAGIRVDLSRIQPL